MALSRRSGSRFQGSIWPGFVDAMTGLLLVLMFVLTIFMVVQFVLTERISGQETELDILQGEVAALAQALGLEQSTSNDLRDRVGALDTSLSQAQAEARAQNRLIAALTEERDAQARTLDAAAAQISGFEAQVAALLLDRTTAEDRMAALQKIQTDLEANRAALETREAALLTEREALTAALTASRTEVDAAAEQARLAAALREKMDVLIADLKSENAESETQIATLTAEMAAGQEALSAEETARLAEIAIAQELRNKLENADQELTTLTLELEKQRQEAENTLTLLAAARASESSFEEALAAALLANTDVAEQLSKTEEEMRSQLAEMQNDLAVSRAETKFLQGQLDDLSEQLLVAQNAVAATELQLADAQEGSTATKIALSEARADTNFARAQLVDAQEAQRQTQEQLRNAQARIAAAEDRLTQARLVASSQSSKLQEQLLAALTDAEALRLTLGEAQSEMKKVQLQLRDALAQAATAEAKLNETQLAANASDADLQAQLGRALAEAQELKLRLDQSTADALKQRDLLREQLFKSQADADRMQLELAQTQDTAGSASEALRARLTQAIAAKLTVEEQLDDLRTEAQKRAALLTLAERALGDEKQISAEALRETELLNQQIAALRADLGSLQNVLDAAQAEDAVREIEMKSLGTRLNTALARAAIQEQRRADLEEAERKRLEAEKQDLEAYRSEFFGQLRDVLSSQAGVRIEGDRFVFSSEVLFPPGGAVISEDGKREIAKVAIILQNVAEDIPPEIDWIIRVDGHTDNVPVGGTRGFADNWELSQARALSVVKYMSDFLSIPPNRLSANGFGEYQPIAPGNSRAARAKNRRIELKFTEK